MTCPLLDTAYLMMKCVDSSLPLLWTSCQPRHRKRKISTIPLLDAGDTLLKLFRADCEADFDMHLIAVLGSHTVLLPGRPQQICTIHPSLCYGDASLGGFSSTNVSALVGRWFNCETLRKVFQLRSYGSDSQTEYHSRG